MKRTDVPLPSRASAGRPRPAASRALAVVLVSLAARVVLAQGPAAAAGPLAQVRATNDRIEKVLKSKKSGDDPGARAEMRRIVNGFLDYDELSRRALVQHWSKITKAQQVEFAKTLREMIEKSYEKKLKSDVDYSIRYGEVTLKDEDARVPTVVRIKTKGKSTEAAIDYKMRRNGTGWVVYDVITDEVSMVKTYREQFDKIIAQESFDALLKKMRKRILEADDGDAGKTAKK